MTKSRLHLSSGTAVVLLCAALAACRTESSAPANEPGEQEPAAPAEQGAADQDMRELREEADLEPASGEDHASSAEELRRELRLRPDPTPPPENEAEMRERMGLHPERVRAEEQEE